MATRTTLWPAAVVVVLELLTTRATPYDNRQVALQTLGAAMGVTVLLSLCLGRVRPFRIVRFVRAGLARLFAPPGTRGTIHARWFVLGFWLVFLVIAVQPAKFAQAHYLEAWLLAFFMMWAFRWFYPRWEPAKLARLSLVVSAQPLLYYLTPPDLVTIRHSALAYIPITSMSLALLWALVDHWSEWRIRSGRHPRYALPERSRDRVVFRERVDSFGYRDSTQGRGVGLLAHRPGFWIEVCVALVFTVAFQFFRLFLWP